MCHQRWYFFPMDQVPSPVSVAGFPRLFWMQPSITNHPWFWALPVLILVVDDDAQNRDNISIIIIILYAVIIINHHHSGDLLTINRHSLNRQDDDLSYLSWGPGGHTPRKQGGNCRTCFQEVFWKWQQIFFCLVKLVDQHIDWNQSFWESIV